MVLNQLSDEGEKTSNRLYSDLACILGEQCIRKGPGGNPGLSEHGGNQPGYHGLNIPRMLLAQEQHFPGLDESARLQPVNVQTARYPPARVIAGIPNRPVNTRLPQTVNQDTNKTAA
mgnify:CR=1 FL=1